MGRVSQKAGLTTEDTEHTEGGLQGRRGRTFSDAGFYGVNRATQRSPIRPPPITHRKGRGACHGYV